MTGKDIFKIWAPSGARWIEWVKPVHFAAIDHKYEEQSNYVCNFTIPKIFYINDLKTDTAAILDLPGHDGIEEGLALAKLGFRPIPLYNGTNEQHGAMPLVDNRTIRKALIWGALELKDLKIADTALPVFLLDSNRAHGFRIDVSVFDNSWDLYGQDMPSPEYFLENGINKIIVRGEKIQKDLAKILYNYQKKGVSIFFTNGYEKPKEVSVKKPHRNIK